ncbi:hypothetical protein [Polynucleobacter necessarius]|uniref:hypothetical protein n=1 Tax=Polynucleobacter necessarius TaxID=576610 RepID=UPI001E5539FC|nr:hypothetical protein [Polynucleobacter necessarius]
MKIRNQRDFGAGVMYMVIGLFFAIMATQYPIGTAAKMGPGYFLFGHFDVPFGGSSCGQSFRS